MPNLKFWYHLLLILSTLCFYLFVFSLRSFTAPPIDYHLLLYHRPLYSRIAYYYLLLLTFKRRKKIYTCCSFGVYHCMYIKHLPYHALLYVGLSAIRFLVIAFSVFQRTGCKVKKKNNKSIYISLGFY